MAYNVLTLKQDLTGVIHGTTLNKVVNLDGIINRAARQVLQDVDPQETKRVVPFATPIFNNVYTYPINADVKGIKIFDIRPQVNRTPGDTFNQDYSKIFNLAQNNSLANQFNVDYNTGIRTFLVNAPLQFPPPVTIEGATGTTINGTWTAGGSASNLTTDNVNYVNGGGSLKFDLAAAGSTGYLQNSTFSAVDLTDDENQATNFLYSFLPTGSNFTNVKLRWGSSSTNYWESTATLTQGATSFADGWNLTDYIWSAATVTGSPDASNVGYLRVTWTYNGTAQTGVRLNNIVTQLGTIMLYGYYSKYLFRSNSTGAFQETVTDDSDLINLDTDSYNLLFNQTAYLVAQQLQGLDAAFYDGSFFLQAYQEGVQKYKNMYKSEVQKPTQVYYSKPNPNYGKYLPRRYN